jgi:YHS domain-containing protein
MLRVERPADAVKLGLALTQDLLAERGYPTIRVGTHHGPAVHRAGDRFGATVNLAARVAGLAHGGEVLLTDATRKRAGDIEGVRFEVHGVHQLRNITEPVKVFSAIPSAGARREVVIDPVGQDGCGPRRAAGTFVHEGRAYYFCSLDCTPRFAGDPGLYASSEAP